MQQFNDLFQTRIHNCGIIYDVLVMSRVKF